MDKTIITITAGVITGLGHSLIFKEGYSTGGLFLLQDIFNSVKIYRRKTFTYIFETIIIILTGFVVNFETSLYSAVLIVIINYMATMSRVGASTSKTFFIITTEETSVKDYILNELHYDLTEINVKGGFTSHKNKIIMTSVDTKDYFGLKEGILLIDPKAFISIVDSYEVLNKNLTIGKKYSE